MILALLAGISIGLGAGVSQGLGEEPGYALAVARYDRPGLRIEATADTSRKVETGRGWLGSLGVQATRGPLLLGIRATHRDAGEWAKTRGWIEAGLAGRWGRAYLSSALTSRDRESALTVAPEIVLGRLAIVPSWTGVLYDQGSRRVGSAWGFSLMLTKRERR